MRQSWDLKINILQALNIRENFPDLKDTANHIFFYIKVYMQKYYLNSKKYSFIFAQIN